MRPFPPPRPPLNNRATSLLPAVAPNSSVSSPNLRSQSSCSNWNSSRCWFWLSLLPLAVALVQLARYSIVLPERWARNGEFRDSSFGINRFRTDNEREGVEIPVTIPIPVNRPTDLDSALDDEQNFPEVKTETTNEESVEEVETQQKQSSFEVPPDTNEESELERGKEELATTTNAEDDENINESKTETIDEPEPTVAPTAATSPPNPRQFTMAPISVTSSETFKGLKVRPLRKDVVRVICLIIQNEEPFLKEWIDFHLLAGWTKIHIWDHNSTDNYRDIIKLYPPGVIELTMIDWPHKLLDQHRSADAQKSAYPRCVAQYWNIAQVIATFDVDEFVFPGKDHWSAKDPFESAAKAIGALKPRSDTTVAAQIDCYQFGYHHLIETPTTDVVFKYPRRAAYTTAEKKSVAAFRTVAKPICAQLEYGCITRALPKFLYFVNNQTTVLKPSIHFFQGPANKTSSVRNDERTTGFLCNHVWVRSMQHLREKNEKNANRRYLGMANLPVDHIHHLVWQSIEDRSAIEFAEQAIRKHRARSKQ